VGVEPQTSDFQLTANDGVTVSVKLQSESIGVNRKGFSSERYPHFQCLHVQRNRHRARSWSRQRHICYKTEHNAIGTNLRFVITNVAGRVSEIFAFYNDRGQCENRIEELKNGFRADRLSCHRFLANAFRLLLYAFAYNLVNLFRLRQLPKAWRSIQIETLRARLFKIGARIRQTARCIRVHLATGWPWQALFARLALALNTS